MLVAIDRVDVNVGVPVVGFKVAVGQEVPHDGPVTAVVRLIELLVPLTSEAVTVAVVLCPWSMAAPVGLTDNE